jgi:phosphoglycerol transferase
VPTWVRTILCDWLIFMAEPELIANRTQPVASSFNFLTQSFSTIARKEWLVWLLGGGLSFVAASLFMSGWPAGLLPELHKPFIYAGDSVSYLWNIKRVIEEAWFFTNTQTGYPFGSNHLDYPTSDTGNYLILKLLGLLLDTPVAVLNVYFLLGFSLAFSVAYIVLKAMGVSRALAVSGAVLYSFTAYHFGRLGHLFFTWYFVAPLFFYYGFRLFNPELNAFYAQQTIRSKALDVLAWLLLASFGIYYALFGSMVLLVSAGLAALLYKSWLHLRLGLLACAVVSLGVLLNVAPSLYYLWTMGPNLEGVNRAPGESELFGLKLSQMLLPRGDHRLDSFYDVANLYNNHFPLVTENMSATLGVTASLGLLMLMVSVFVVPMLLNTRIEHSQQKRWLNQMLVMGLLACSLFFVATVGGFASLFALLVSASIRSWNRISIFIEFIAIAAFVLSFDGLLRAYFHDKYWRIARGVLVCVFLFYATADQTAKPCLSCIQANSAAFENDKTFVKRIETSVPINAAIYQLPYMGYPEYGSVNGLGSYDQARGHLHSSTLKWNFGGIRGRDGDWFYRKLAHLPVEQQMTVLQALGFSGIYVNRRGYVPMGDKRCLPYMNNKSERIKYDCLTALELEQDIVQGIKTLSLDGAMGNAAFASGDQHIVFYSLPAKANMRLSSAQALAQANRYLLPIGFEIVNGVPVTAGGFEDVIDFRTSDFPPFMVGVTGLAVPAENLAEPIGSAARMTGRWSNAYMAPAVKLWLAKPLPAKLTLAITARGGGPNAGQPLQIKIGKQTKELIFGADMQTKTIEFELTEQVRSIEFKPYQPFVPARRWGDADVRKLGVEFQQIKISGSPI